MKMKDNNQEISLKILKVQKFPYYKERNMTKKSMNNF